MRRLWAVLGAVAFLTACSNPREAPIVGSGDALGGELTVFAAASLTDAFTDAKTTIERAHRRLSLTYNFAGSQVLAQQIIEGAPADVVATADTRTMDRLVAAGLVERPVVLARNSLVIAVEPGNPEGITGLDDLARPGLAVVLADPSVPVGAYAATALARAGVTVRPRSLELDVKAALAKVTAGEADAAIVYTTDVTAARSRASSVAIADADNQFATYPIAVVRTTAHKRAARALLTELARGRGRAALRARGFRLP